MKKGRNKTEFIIAVDFYFYVNY